MTSEPTPHAGIYDDFPGYRMPSDEELAHALRSALIVVDANVLLNLYRYNESTRDDLLGILRRIGDRLWVPHQVLREFWRNRLGVLASRGAGTTQALDALAKQQRAATDAIRQWAKTVAVEASYEDQLLSKVDALHNELEHEIQTHAPAVSKASTGTASEPVLGRLEELLQGKAGRRPNDSEWESAVKEGNERVSRKEPPGYLDAEKGSSDLQEGAAGDYLVWRQATDEAARRGLDLLLVTGDEKEDWWWRHRSEFLGPRVELVAEFKNRSGHKLYMMRPIDLLRRSSALHVVVRKESVDDVERVSRESNQALWSAAGIGALLRRLETEGREQAEVIRVAALNAGTINRNEVYEICGYKDDRMLRGFTLPTTRITHDLQQEGIVAEGVEPALTTIYHGGVKAAAFHIPSEMVAILTEDQRVDPDERQP
jgi:predicted nucleic acid-binding protein